MKRISILTMIFMLIFSSIAFAKKGIISYYNDYSRAIIIQLQNGYTCGEVWSYNSATWDMKRGDIVVGELDSYGSHEIYNLTLDISFTMYADLTWASYEDAINWLQTH